MSGTDTRVSEIHHCPVCKCVYNGEKCYNCGYKAKYVPTDCGPVFLDNVNNPSHYGQGKIEAIEYIEDFLTEEEYKGYLRGNIAKYLHRYRYKNGVEDLKKAQWYLNRLVEKED